MATKIIITAFVLLHVIHIINGQNKYIGAVVEFSPEWDASRKHVDNLITNAYEYKNRVTSAKEKGASIVVFPEYGLTTRDLPESLDDVSFLIPEQGNLPPQGDQQRDKVLDILSTVAKEESVYVVVNLIEKSNSSNKIYYNTNVVFDRSGGIMKRYRKINLHNEDRLTRGDECVTFKTDFGVTFGILISDDILFKTPAKDILDTDVTDVVYSTAWYSERPMLTAISIQDGYSKASGVNLLASGLSNPSKSLTGSGIYYANSTVVNDIIVSTAPQTQTIIKYIPIIPQRTPDSVCENNVKPSPRIGSVPDISAVVTSSENFKHYTFQNLNTNGDQSVCSKDFCCNFDISGDYKEGDYKLGAFSGSRKYHEKTIGVRVCVLVACERNSRSSCEVVKVGSELPAKFTHISISGNFSGSNDTFYQPSTLTGELRPTSGYSFCTTGSVIRMVQINPQDSILSFGIFGRVYDYDGREEGAIGNNGSEPTNSVCIVLLFVCIIYIMRCVCKCKLVIVKT